MINEDTKTQELTEERVREIVKEEIQRAQEKAQGEAREWFKGILPSGIASLAARANNALVATMPPKSRR